MIYRPEAEAIEKGCPMGMSSHVGAYVRCVGSKCMAWQWAPGLPRTRFDGPRDMLTGEPPRPDAVPASWTWEFDEEEGRGYWLEPEAEAQKRWRGRCGMVPR